MRFIAFLGISALLLLGACREEKPTRIAPKPIHSIVFVDGSARVGRDTAYPRGTDIWGSIGVLAAQMDTTAITRAYYLSDMLACTKGESRRNFRERPPGNRTEATRRAAGDAVHLQKQLPRIRWQSTGLFMVLPFGPMSTTQENNPAVTHYWEELFRQLGVPGAITELHP